MKIGIVGLGLMGGSYAIGLSQKGYAVYGIDTNLKALDFAIKKGIITGVLSKEELSRMDVIILAIYPQAILKFLQEHQPFLKSHQIITDICGVKSSFVEEATRLALPAIYCSTHPMAGKEKIGIEYANSDIFLNANYLITPIKETPQKAIECLSTIGKDLGFGKISIVDIHKHDKMIGFTSQLTHAIAVSLVNSDCDADTVNFIGDSYRDLTRIAMINEALWSELFIENKEVLLNHIEAFEKSLDELKQALKKEEKNKLAELFQHSNQIRKKMEKCES